MNSYGVELTKKEERYRSKVQKLIEYCEYCQPYDEGEVVWIYGDRVELQDLLYQCKIPENSWDNVIVNLCCPYCQHTNFDINLNVGVRTKFEKDVEDHMDKVLALYGHEVREFEEYLEKYPTLAFNNKFAKKIYKELKEKKLPILEIEGCFYRSRKVETSEVLSTANMHQPPIGKPTEGRFNHAGQSHLYLANDKRTAIKEVIQNEASFLVWCQEFKIVNSVNNILDLSFDWDYLTPSTSTLLLSLKIYNSVGRTDRNKELWRPDYYLTRFIMDCAKSLGYKGIKYNSTKDEHHFDLVLFHPDQINIVTVGNPIIEIFLNKEEKDNFNSDLDVAIEI